METTLKRFGNSVGLVIPKAYRESLGFAVGQTITLEPSDDGLLLRRAARQRYTLDELLEQCDLSAPVPAAVDEWDDVPAVGKEIW